MDQCRLNCAASGTSDTPKTIETTESACTSTSTADSLQSSEDQTTSGASKSRKRKAILLPDDYHTKSSIRKLEKGILKL